MVPISETHGENTVTDPSETVVPSLFGAVLLIGQDHTLWVGKGMLSRDK